MHINLAVNLVSMLMIGATSMPLSPTSDTSLNPKSVLLARDTYDCKGSSLCSSLQVVYCDEAVNNQIIRNDDINYGAPGSGRQYTGACQSVAGQNGYAGCAVFIQGDKTCARSGNDIWWDYQAIRSAGCAKCGSRHWGTNLECLTTINYVDSCSTGSH